MEDYQGPTRSLGSYELQNKFCKWKHKWGILFVSLNIYEDEYYSVLFIIIMPVICYRSKLLVIAYQKQCSGEVRKADIPQAW